MKTITEIVLLSLILYLGSILFDISILAAIGFLFYIMLSGVLVAKLKDWVYPAKYSNKDLYRTLQTNPELQEKWKTLIIELRESYESQKQKDDVCRNTKKD